jgi:hypothetical protein
MRCWAFLKDFYRDTILDSAKNISPLLVKPEILKSSTNIKRCCESLQRQLILFARRGAVHVTKKRIFRTVMDMDMNTGTDMDTDRHQRVKLQSPAGLAGPGKSSLSGP